MTTWWENRKQIARFVVGLGTAILLILVARMLPLMTFRQGLGIPVTSLGAEDFPLIRTTADFSILRYIIWTAVLLSLGYILFTREGRKAIPDIVRQTAVALFWGLVIFSIVRVSLPELPLAEEFTEAPPALVTELPTPEEPLGAPGAEPVYAPEPPLALTRVLSTLVIAGTGLLLYRWWRGRPSLREEGELDFAELARRANLAIAELQQGQKLDDVILRCYREMADTVAMQRGLRRGRGETPREFEHDLLRIGLPPRAVQRLTRLFELVRYGGYQPVQRDQLEAIDSLNAIVAACAPVQQGERPS